MKLSCADIDEGVALSDDQLTVQFPRAKEWIGARATHGVVPSASPMFYYEVTPTGGKKWHKSVFRAGFATLTSSLNIGSDDLSFGLGSSATKLHNGEYERYGETWGPGHVLGVLLRHGADVEGSGIEYFKDGVSFGVGFELPASLAGEVLYPAVCGHFLAEAQVNFGNTDFKYPVTRMAGFAEPVAMPAPAQGGTVDAGTACKLPAEEQGFGAHSTVAPSDRAEEADSAAGRAGDAAVSMSLTIEADGSSTATADTSMLKLAFEERGRAPGLRRTLAGPAAGRTPSLLSRIALRFDPGEEGCLMSPTGALRRQARQFFTQHGPSTPLPSLPRRVIFLPASSALARACLGEPKSGRSCQTWRRS